MLNLSVIQYSRYPVSRKLSEFVSAVGRGRERLLELVIGLPVIPAHTNATVLDIHIFEGVMTTEPKTIGSQCTFHFPIRIVRQLFQFPLSTPNPPFLYLPGLDKNHKII
jgi:hypothetical protein